MIEKLVEFLVGKVDAQLLKRVMCKVLETKNVQDANKFLCIGSRICCTIDAIHLAKILSRQYSTHDTSDSRDSTIEYHVQPNL